MKIKIWSFCALISVLVAAYSLSFAEDFEEGIAAYNKGDHTATYQIFLKEAQKGNANAQYNLGLMYVLMVREWSGTTK